MVTLCRWLRRLFCRPPPVQRSTSLLSALDYIRVQRDTINVRDLTEDDLGPPEPPPRLGVWEQRHQQRARWHY